MTRFCPQRFRHDATYGDIKNYLQHEHPQDYHDPIFKAADVFHQQLQMSWKVSFDVDGEVRLDAILGYELSYKVISIGHVTSQSYREIVFPSQTVESYFADLPEGTKICAPARNNWDRPTYYSLPTTRTAGFFSRTYFFSDVKQWEHCMPRPKIYLEIELP